jgi:hypothetical protein
MTVITKIVIKDKTVAMVFWGRIDTARDQFWLSAFSPKRGHILPRCGCGREIRS